MENVYKEFPIEVVASVYSGIMCCNNFSDVHECVEWIKGHPVWTHEMGSGSFFKEICGLVLDQSGCNFSGLTKENALEWVNRRRGEVVEINKGSGKRDKNPLQTAIEILNKPTKGE